jgi:hypothetical protein
MREQAGEIRKALKLLHRDVEIIEERAGKLETHLRQAGDDVSGLLTASARAGKRAERLDHFDFEELSPDAGETPGCRSACSGPERANFRTKIRRRGRYARRSAPLTEKTRAPPRCEPEGRSSPFAFFAASGNVTHAVCACQDGRKGMGDSGTMGKRDELIAQYAEDLRSKCGMDPDMDLLTKVTIGCGPAIYDADASTVAASQPGEIETVKKNFLMKKLGPRRQPRARQRHRQRDRDLRQVRAQQVPRRRLLHARQAFRQRGRLRLRPTHWARPLPAGLFAEEPRRTVRLTCTRTSAEPVSHARPGRRARHSNTRECRMPCQRDPRARRISGRTIRHSSAS